jgi:hypothetical protein
VRRKQSLEERRVLWSAPRGRFPPLPSPAWTAGQDAVANAMILHGHKFGDPVMDGPFANPARIQEIIETARPNNLQTS